MVTIRFTTPDGIKLELDADPYDYARVLRETLELLREPLPPSVMIRPGSPVRASTGPPPSRLTQSAMRKVVDRLAEDTIAYLRLLAEHEGGLDDHQIMAHLDFDNRRRIAGMNAAVTKVANDVGITETIIESDVTRGTDGARTYHYVLSAPARELLPDVLPPAPDDTLVVDFSTVVEPAADSNSPDQS